MPYRVLTAAGGALLDAAAPLAGPTLRERLSRGVLPPPAVIWLHGASVGEIASAGVVIRELSAQTSLLVTANTATGCAAARALGVSAVLAPLDTPQAVGRFLDSVRPHVAVTVENELWPNRSAALNGRGVRQVVIGARLSMRSARRWGRMEGLIRPMLGRLDAVSAQDRDSEARLLSLGLPQRAVLPRVNLKLLGPARQPRLPAGPHRTHTILAASTHADEEALVVGAFIALRASGTPVRLIVAPRHPQRFEAVAALMSAAGLAPARRSAGAGADAPILLADSMGEMPLWHAAAGICLTGGSLVDAGGHTPWEPAAQHCAILHGPSVTNFSVDYQRLDQMGAALAVTRDELAGALARLLASSQMQQRMGTAANRVLMEEAGDSRPLVDHIVTLACD